MQVHIKLKNERNDLEWMMIELQGELESSAHDLSSKFIGDLHFMKSGIPVLIIGHHILYGKVVDLSKPFLALAKSSEPQTSDEETTYFVQGIIRRKLLFKSRPKPIIIPSETL